MSERKVLNKYYPPDYDPSKIPKVRQEKNRQWNIRIMAPFNMRCNTCGEYIYKGKKFNSRKEDVEGERTYMDLKVFRFYIKCPRCVAEIAFRTDPENADYALEGGATRNFEALRTAEQLARKQAEDKEEEEKNNPMKVLENRTKASQREMDMIETLEELRELNARQAQTDHGHMIKVHKAYEEQLEKLQDEEDEKFIDSLFGKNGETKIKRLADDTDDAEQEPPRKSAKPEKPTDILTDQTGIEKPLDSEKKTTEKKSLWQAPSWQKSVGGMSSKSLSGLIKKKSQPLVNSKNSSITASKKSDCEENKSQIANVETKQNSIVLEQNSIFDKKVTAVKKEVPNSSGLGLVGNYSDSSSGDDDT